jgi:hypothetical protein
MTRPITRLEDINDMKADEFVGVIETVDLSYEGQVKLSHIGFVYNIGIDRFSLIEPMVTDDRCLGRVNYDWNASNKTWVCSIDSNQPFEKGSSEYLKYETALLNRTITMGAIA